MAVTAAFAVVSFAVQQRQQKKAAKAEKEGREIQGKRDAIENARGRRRALAESRRARAQAVSAGTTGGVGSSSAVAGAAGAVQTQGAANVSFLNQIEGLNLARLNKLGEASDAASKAATAQAVGNTVGQLGFKPNVTNLSFFNRG